MSLIVPMVTLMLVTAFSSPQCAYNDGGDAADQGLYTEAISHYDKAIQLKPNYAKAYVNRGITYGELGQYQRAIEDFDKAIRLDPNEAMAYVGRSLTYDMLGEDAKAAADKAKACSLGDWVCD